MPSPVVVGSILSHGGTVTEGSSSGTWEGLPISIVGDKAVCSTHGTTTIVEGSTILRSRDGISIALIGHKCACGAVIESLPPGVSSDLDIVS